MRRHIAFILVAVAVAGCLGNGGGTDGGTGTSGHALTIHQAELTDTAVTTGEPTQLIVRLENTHRTPVNDVDVTLSNLGPFAGGTTLSEGTGPDAQTCHFSSIPAATEASPTRRICVWTLEASSAESTQTYPISVSLSYDATLETPAGDLSFSFEDDVTGQQRGTHTVRLGNDEIGITAAYPDPVRIAAEEVTMDLTVRNTGSGDIVTDGDQRSVDLSYGGPMMGLFSTNHCGQAVFLTDSQSTTIECTLEKNAGASISAGTVYPMQITASYRYQRYRELSLELQR